MPLRPGAAAGRLAAPLVAAMLGGCSVHDSYIARSAQSLLLGLPEADLVACLGVPDQHMSFPQAEGGPTDVLTWIMTSTSTLSFTPPVVGGFTVSNGGSCRVTIRVDRGVATHVIYSGEKNATGAPDAYCAPIVRSCLAQIEQDSQAASRIAAQAARRAASQGAAAVRTEVVPGEVVPRGVVGGEVSLPAPPPAQTGSLTMRR